MSGIAVSGQKDREILFGDAHEVAQAVGPQDAGLDPAAGGAGRHRAALGDLLNRHQRAGRTRCGRWRAKPRSPG